MKKNYLLILLPLIFSLLSFTSMDKEKRNHPDKEEKTVLVTAVPPIKTCRSFASLDQKVDKALRQLTETAVVQEFGQKEIFKRFDSDTTAINLRNKAQTVIDKVIGENRFLKSITDYVTGQTPIALPVGIKKEVGSSEFIMGVSQIKLGKEYAELELFVRLKLPQIDETGKQRELFFGASRVKLSHKGGLYGDADLVLLGDVAVPFNSKDIMLVLKGGFDLKTGNFDKKTYVTVDCDGFKELGLAADVEFSRKMIVPVKPDNTVDNATIPGTSLPKKVTTSFEITATDWNDILVQVNLPKFQVPKLKNTIFEVNTAIFDFSDLRNASNMSWPSADYQSKYLIDGEEQLWRGVYVESITIVLPEQFSKKGSNQRISFAAEKLLIDNNGVSGTFKGENLLPINQGTASGWQFSVDRFQIGLEANNLTKAGFGGALVLPVTSETVAEAKTETYLDENGEEKTRFANIDYESGATALVYNALIDPVNNEYVLNASPAEAIAFNVFRAKATLTKNSFVELKVIDGKFRPKAVLHGNMAIKGSNSGTSSQSATADFEGITFENFQLQTVSPIIKIGRADYTGDVKVGNFPATISQIGIRAQDKIAALDFTLAINLMDKGGFAGETSLSIEGALDKGEGFEKWKFKRIKLSRVEIAADLGFKINGFVEFREDDPVFGNGFSGQVTAEFQGGISVQINATFGKKEFRYWYVDGLVKGLDIAIPTGISIVGFGGGASYRMKKAGYGNTATAGDSGIAYVPDRASGLTVKAMMLFSTTGSQTMVNGGFGFEMAFNKSGGINRISFYGEGHLMQEQDWTNADDELTENLGGIVNNETNMSESVQNQLKNSDLIEASKAIYPAVMEGQKGLNAYVALEFNFADDSFHGTFELYIDLAGGLFQGVGSGGRAGWAVVHFSPSKWYIHVGTPTDPIGIKIGVGDMALRSESYFMMGDYMPASPPPPAEVAEILGVKADKLDYMRNENLLAKGKGIAFGSKLAFDTGDMTFLAMYARFQAGVGFDIMVANYGNTSCRGSGQIGIDGWYANGQAYVYLKGSLGIKVKIFGKTKRFKIIEAGAATLLQAKLPNPVWLRGYLGGYYNLLGGLIKGKFRFEMQFGEECDVIGGESPVGDIKIIADVTPRENAEDVDVFAVPQVAFNMPVGSTFSVEDENFETKTFRIKLDNFSLKNSKGTAILGLQEMSPTNDLISFTSDDILTPNEQMTLSISVTFEEKVNGKWQVLEQDGAIFKEERKVIFTTGTAPDYIPQTNIAYCYPVIGQKYFLPKEYNKGYIALKRGQPYLFQLEPNWSQKAFFADEFDQALETSISYNAGNKQVLVPLPDLEPSKKYFLKLYTIPPAGESSSLVQAVSSSGAGDNTMEVRTVQIDGLTTNPETIEMLAFEFNTSAHATFKDKMQNKVVTNSLREIISSDVHKLKAVVQPSEPFEKVELFGNTYTSGQPLVEVAAQLNDTYYTQDIYPLLYKNYPIENRFKVNRDTTLMGIPPKRAMDILTWYETYLEHSPESPELSERMPHTYNLSLYYKTDFADIQYKMILAYVNSSGSFADKIEKYQNIINEPFPILKSGNYDALYTYKLPGEVAKSTSSFRYINPE